VDVVEAGDRWVAYLADVSGHGVASGALMGMFKTAVRTRLESSPSSLSPVIRRSCISAPDAPAPTSCRLVSRQFVSDGLMEVFDSGDHEFGLDRLKRTLIEVRDRPLNEVFDAVVADVRRHGRQLDDQSLLLIRVGQA
jgi:serine phosphatase RsbU (regulator of sigma subunit)